MSDPNNSHSAQRDEAARLCLQAFHDLDRWPDSPAISAIEDINRGRGAFSAVLRVTLDWPAGKSNTGYVQPASVVVKLPVAGQNGHAARKSGAYRREALAYRELLANDQLDVHPTALTTPLIHLIEEPGDETCSLVMEDLTGHRAVDQLDGLGPEDAFRVAEGLAQFHRLWTGSERLANLAVRHNTIAGLSPEALAAGLQALGSTWADVVTDQQRAAYGRLAEAQPQLVKAFAVESATLCHGDPRADNLVFGHSADTGGPGNVVLFDWQQMAVQFGEADLAWLSATSVEVEERRRIDHDLVAAYGGSFDRYRLGLALPGMTVLLLAQREATSERLRRFIATSLKRIAAAIDDLDVADLV